MLDYYGICYFNDVSKPANRITEEDMECDFGEYKVLLRLNKAPQ